MTYFLVNPQGHISAQGILHLRNPNLGPNSGKQILDLNSWVEFICPCFPAQEAPLKNSYTHTHPQEIHLPKSTFQNSTQKWGKVVTLHLCRAIWLKITLPQKESGTRNLAKSDEKSHRSVRKSDQKVTKNEKSDRTPLPTSVCGTLRKI